MRRCILLMSFLLPGILLAQEAYKSLLEEGKTWRMKYTLVVWPNYGDLYYYEESTLKGDTVIDGISFKQEVRRSSTGYGETEFGAWQFTDYWLGEKNGRIYQYDQQRKTHCVIMDVSLQQGDTLAVYESEPEIDTMTVVAVSDTVFDCSSDKQQRCCVYVNRFCGKVYDRWVEGIGSLQFGIMGVRVQSAYGCFPELVECRKNGEVLFTYDSQTSGIRPQPLKDSTLTPAFYDLQGRRLTGKPCHGLYIRDGKKYLVR